MKARIEIGTLEPGTRVRFADDARFPMLQVVGRYGQSVLLRNLRSGEESSVGATSHVAYAERVRVSCDGSKGE